MPGRIPKPTNLKQVLGNPGHRPLNENEPQPEGEVVRPKFLKGRAAKIWQEYAPQLIRMKILTAVDAHTFAAWCALAAEFEKDPKAFTAARYSQMRAIASSFGMDASSRSRLSVNGEESNPTDPTSKYFNYVPGPDDSVRQ